MSVGFVRRTMAQASVNGWPGPFPTHVLIYEADDGFAAEVLGCSISNAPQECLRRKKLRSIENFLGAFPSSDDPPALAVTNSTNVSFHDFSCGRDGDAALLRTRYPELRLPDSQIVSSAGPGDFTPIVLRQNGLVVLTNFRVVGAAGANPRLRYFQAAWVTDRSIPRTQLARDLRGALSVENFDGSQLIPRGDLASHPDMATAANFASLTGIEGIGEVTITDFVSEHPEVLRGLGAVRVISGESLPWLVRPPHVAGSSERVVPDFLIEDAQGLGHILDFKLPLLNRKNVVRGASKNRHRPIDAINEGIAQLQRYKADYFSVPEHLAYVEDTYGLAMSDDPRLVLVVGSSENVEKEQLDLAMEQYSGRFEIIDYDTVRAMYLYTMRKIGG